MLEVFEAKKGGYTAAFNGNLLLSGYDPSAEAAKIAAQLVGRESGDRLFLLFGTAVGLLPKAMLALGIPPSSILALEPHEKLAAISRAECPEIQWMTPVFDLPGFVEQGLMQRRRPVIAGVESWKKAWSAEWHSFEKFAADSVRTAVENTKVSGYFSRLWTVNLIRNIARYQERPSDSFIFQPGLRTGAPVVVAASGPSLDFHLEDIRRNREGIVLLSVLSAARTLLLAGIRPDAIAVSDAGVANTLHAVGVPADIPVIASPYASGSLLQKLPNPVAYHGLVAEIFAPTWRLSLPSVSIDAGEVARMLSVKAPVFAGFDLSNRLPRGSHSSGNALFELRRRGLGRCRSADLSLLGFARRNDLMSDQNGGWTTAQYRMIADLSAAKFPGAFVLRGGLERQGWRTLESLSEIADRSAASAGRESLKASMVRQPDLDGKGRDLIFRVKEALQKRDRNSLAKWFVREALAGLPLEPAADSMLFKV